MSKPLLYPAHPHELDALCLGGRFAAVDGANAASTEDVSAVELAVPLLHPLAFGADDTAGSSLTGLSDAEVEGLLLGNLLAIDGEVVPVAEVLPADAEAQDAQSYGWGLERLLKQTNDNPEVKRARARFTERGRRPSDLLLYKLPVLPRVLWGGGEVDQGSTGELYRRVLSLNARLALLFEAAAPHGPVHNAIQALTNAVELLFLNGWRGVATDEKGRVCVSLRDLLLDRCPDLDLESAIRGDAPAAPEPHDPATRQLLTAFSLVRLTAREEVEVDGQPALPIRELGLSLRTLKKVKALGIQTAGEIAACSEAELEEAGFGRVDLRNLREALANVGLSLLG